MSHSPFLGRTGSHPFGLHFVPASKGFTLIETMVAGLVLVVGLIAITQFFASAAARITGSDTRSMMMQVANREMEDVRALPYEDVGTTDGHPEGSLAPTSSRDEDGLQLTIHREVVYVTDSSYSGPYPANYRRITVTVSAVSQPELAPVVVSSFVAGGAPGGTLDVLVTRADGTPIPDAHIEVINTHLNPDVNISSSAMRTDAFGRLIIPGLTPDSTPSYHVVASKSGYNSDWTDPDVVVNDGVPYTSVTLILEPLSTLVIHLVDPTTQPLADMLMTITGPWDFLEQQSTGDDGTVTLADIPYSPQPNGNYNVALDPDQGYEPASTDVQLPSGTTLHVELVAVPLTTTTTLAPSSTTTTVAPSTTTTRLGSLLVRVRRAGSGDNLRDAYVTLGDFPERRTNDRGRTTFSNVPFGTYSLVVTKTNYYPYTGEVTVDSDNTVTIYLTRR